MRTLSTVISTMDDILLAVPALAGARQPLTRIVHLRRMATQIISPIAYVSST